MYATDPFPFSLFPRPEIYSLFLPQHPRSSSLGTAAPLLLVSLVKRDSTCMVSAYVVEVFNLIDPDNPVLACKCLFQRAERRALLRQSSAADAVLGLTGGEE